MFFSILIISWVEINQIINLIKTQLPKYELRASYIYIYDITSFIAISLHIIVENCSTLFVGRCEVCSEYSTFRLHSRFRRNTQAREGGYLFKTCKLFFTLSYSLFPPLLAHHIKAQESHFD